MNNSARTLADDSGDNANEATRTLTLERGFGAALRWFAAESDARDGRGMAVELRALRQTLAALDETRASRDVHAQRAAQLDREIAVALAALESATAMNDARTLLEQLTRLRERLDRDRDARRQLAVERDAWRSMATLMTRTRRQVHESLAQAEQDREALARQARALHEEMLALQIAQQRALHQRQHCDESVEALRQRLQDWSITAARSLAQLDLAAADIVSEYETMRHDPPPATEPAAAPSESKTRVLRTYLRLDRREQFKAPGLPRGRARWLPLWACTVAEWRQLYRDIGAAWHWHDRDAWPDEQLADRLARSDVRVFRVDASPHAQSDAVSTGVGFVELERHPDGSVEIVYLGLAQPVHGLGLGGWLLQRAVEESWSMGATRVWVHTCTLDAPQALPNYLARGFVIEREEEYFRP